MKIIKLKQGSPEWLAYRAQHFNASDAPAMMNCSPYKSRSELVRELATGITPEVTPEQQAIFDRGHLFERLARPLAVKIIGEELFPVVGESGKYSASFDGITVMEEKPFEHKTLNAALRDAMVDGCTGADLPLVYQVQMEHQAMVAGEQVEAVLFMASQWEVNQDTGAWELVEERHCWYTPNPELRAQIVAGWDLLEKDVAAYDPAQDARQADKPSPKLQQALPALRIDTRGEVTASNLDEFQAIAMARITSINTVLETDQDFADADADAKWLREVSQGMKAAVLRVRAGMESVDEVLRVLEHLDTLSTAKAIDLEKRVKSEKEARKLAIVQQAQADLIEHTMSVNRQLQAEGAGHIPAPPAGLFGPCIKGLKILDSMRDKVAGELATQQGKINAQRDRMLINRAILRHENGDWIFLFADFPQVGTKDPEDFAALAALRIGNHRRAEAERLEKERERIRGEEQERADREARARLAADAMEAKAEIEQALRDGDLAPPLAADLGDLVAVRHDEAAASIDARHAIGAAQASAQAAPVPGTIVDAELPKGCYYAKDGTLMTADGTRSVFDDVDDDGSTLTIGQLNARLSPIKIDAAGIEALGFTITRVKAAVHFPAFRFPALCQAIAKRAMEAATEPQEPSHA